MHLTTGELIRLISSDACWPWFKQYFPGSKKIILNKLEEINTVRNSLAHFRPIQKGDLDLVKQNANHALSEINNCLHAIFNITKTVPTNTPDDWYQELKAVDSANCDLTFTTSNDNNWIQLSLKYHCETFNTTRYAGSHIWYNLPKLITPNVLTESPILQDLIIYISESTPYLTMPEGFNPQFFKNIHMTFDKKTIESDYAEIKGQIETILSLLIEETELVKNDNLAEGKIIELVRVLAHLDPQDKTWSIGRGDLSSAVTKGHPPEYWGDIGRFYGNSIIPIIHKYPWMPVNISSIELPF